MSNSLGSIYGTTKNGDKHIKVNTDYFDVSATFLISKNGIQFNKNQSELLNNDNSLINKVNNMLNTNNDASFNNVDVSGTLNVQGEKVITVPTTDSDGNALTADTTYQITTGPAGSIDNISFVKKYHLSAQSQSISLSGHTTMVNWGIGTESAGASSLNTTSGVWTCPATGVYWIYYVPYYTGTRFQQTDTRLYLNGSSDLGARHFFTPHRSDDYVDDVGDVAIPISIMRPLSANDTVYLSMRVVSASGMNGIATLHIQRIN